MPKLCWNCRVMSKRLQQITQGISLAPDSPITLWLQPKVLFLFFGARHKLIYNNLIKQHGAGWRPLTHTHSHTVLPPPTLTHMELCVNGFYNTLAPTWLRGNKGKLGRRTNWHELLWGCIDFCSLHLNLLPFWLAKHTGNKPEQSGGSWGALEIVQRRQKLFAQSEHCNGATWRWQGK